MNYPKKEHDDYYTRKNTWENISSIIPKDKVIWEACLLHSNEQSKKYLEELGFNVVGDTTIDILKHDLGDVIVTNIPFSLSVKKKILQRIVDLKKPFIIIMNSTHIHTKYFHDITKGLDIKFIIPRKKIHYDKYNGCQYIESKNNTSFYSLYVTHGILNQNMFI